MSIVTHKRQMKTKIRCQVIVYSQIIKSVDLSLAKRFHSISFSGNDRNPNRLLEF